MSLPVRRRALVVLGFHRSGTSMLMRLLNLLGVDLGPEEDLLPAVEGDNPRGYWEPRWVNELNDAILAQCGGTYDDPPRLPAGWHGDPALDSLRADARQGLERAFGEAALWGLKDPRLCLTLPFWQPLLAEQAEELLYVHALRSPVETTRSMLRRNIYPGTDAAFWARAWLQHTASALEATLGLERRLVFYDELVAGGADVLDAVATLVGIPAPEGEAAERLGDAIEGDLRHHAADLVGTARDSDLPAGVRASYVALSAARDARVTGSTDLGDALEHIPVALWAELTQVDATVAEFQAEISTTQSALRRLAVENAKARMALA